jgi:hypothetical protein
MAARPVDPQKQAAALEALRTAVPPRPLAATFWDRHGGKVVFAVALVLGVWLFARVVGRFIGHSVAETSRAEEELRRGLRR